MHPSRCALRRGALRILKGHFGARVTAVLHEGPPGDASARSQIEQIACKLSPAKAGMVRKGGSSGLWPIPVRASHETGRIS
jgi:hypothetical protein